MALAMLCGGDYGLLELITATIKERTADGAWFIAISIKTEDTINECGRKMTTAEKIKSSISILECPGGNIVVLNVLTTECECLNCGTEIPCHDADLSFDEKINRVFGYTTDGEWALRIGYLDKGRQS